MHPRVHRSTQMPQMNTRRSRVSTGFTLIEILVVITIIAILLAITGSSFTGAMRGMAITNAGNKVTQMCEAARQRAMATNVLTAVVLVTNADDPEDGRAMMVMEYPPGGSAWKQVSEWESLPNGTTVDLNSTTTYNSFVTDRSPLPFASGDSVKFRGAPLSTTQYAARVFVPSGGLLDTNQRSQLQVVDGESVNGSTTYSKSTTGGVPDNYYRVTILGATGKTKVERPSL